MNFFNDVKTKVNSLFVTKNTYEVKGKKFYEEKLLGEGGFGYVYLVTDELGKQYALKKLNIQESSQLQAIKRELNFWQNFNNHPNIIKLLSFDYNDKVALILMEYSNEGNLFKYINDEFIEKNHYIKEEKALVIFKQILSAIYHIHSCKIENKAIQHRDIKIENILKFGDSFKVCDFGSCSVETLDPNKVSKTEVKEHFSRFERNTTFIYRPPEMVDEYSGFPINEKVDVWMLGCVLFVLLYKTHPFLEGQKSTIINAHYYFPATGIYSEKIDDLIRLMLTQNPKDRPSCSEVLKILNNWSTAEIKLTSETLEIKKKQKKSTGVTNPNISSGFNPISIDQLKAAQESILKNQSKKGKFKNNSKYKMNI
jgi:AP2-associated kinase